MKHFIRFISILMLFVFALTLGISQHEVSAASLPCDIYAAGGTPCVAAHSTVRALFAAYNGRLYQVRRASNSQTLDIGVLSAGGYANAAAQDSFCSGTTCVITILYDQSGHGNDLLYQGSGGAGGQDNPSTATSESLTANGNKVYSLYINPGNSYWRNGSSTGIPTGSAPQGAYMVTSGTHVNNGCCFDYGNSETDRKADGAGAMDAIYFGTSCWFGGCSGSGPWVQADLEYGLYSGGSQSWNTGQQAFTSKYVTAMLKNNGTTAFALKGGNAQSGGLTTLWNGSLPPGYSPMKQQGAIVLGSGGDCCATNTNLSLGTFYEGAIVAGYPSDTTDNSVQASIVAAGYGVSGPTQTPAPTSTPAPETPYGGTRWAIPGKIEVENYDNGGEGVAYHDSDTTNQGGQYRTDGVDVETTGDTGGGYDVGYTVAGEWLKYSVNVTTSGTYNIDFRVASTSASSFHLEVDGTNVTGTMTLPNTGAWQTYTTVTKSGVSLSAGTHVLRLYEEATNGNYNWMNFSLASGATNTPTFVPPTKTNTPVPTAGPSSTPAPTKTNTPVPTSGPTATPNSSDPCASPTVISGGGTFAVTTASTCFKYVNSSFVNGGMYTVMKDASSASDTLKWYGGMDQNVTSCANQSATISGNGGQLDNFTIAKDANGQMFLVITGTASNSVTISIQNWQNGTGCSVKPTIHP